MEKYLCLSLTVFTVSILISISMPGCKSPTSTNVVAGRRWIQYNSSNSSLIRNQVNALYFDRQGRMWVASDSGVSYTYYNYNYWRFFLDEIATTGTKSVTSITQGNDNRIWFGLYGGGIVCYSEHSTLKQWRYYTFIEKIPSNFIIALTSDDLRGEIWCATLSGVGRFVPTTDEEGTWTTFTIDNSSLPTNQTRSIALNRNDNSIWIGTHNRGVVWYDGNSNWRPPIELTSENYPIISMAFDRNKDGWFGKWEGASRLNTQTSAQTHYRAALVPNFNFPPGPVNAVLADFTTRWFGTNGGLIRLQDTTWTSFTRLSTNDSLPSDTITALTYDIKGNLWIGTPQGIAIFNEEGTRF